MNIEFSVFILNLMHKKMQFDEICIVIINGFVIFE